MPSWNFFGKTAEQEAVDKETQEHVQRKDELLAQRPVMVTKDPEDMKRVQEYRAKVKVETAERKKEVKKLTDRKNLVNSPLTIIGDDVDRVQPASDRHLNLGSTDRPEVQAVREKMARARQNHPDRGVLGVFQNTAAQQTAAQKNDHEPVQQTAWQPRR